MLELCPLFSLYHITTSGRWLGRERDQAGTCSNYEQLALQPSCLPALGNLLFLLHVPARHSLLPSPVQQLPLSLGVCERERRGRRRRRQHKVNSPPLQSTLTFLPSQLSPGHFASLPPPPPPLPLPPPPLSWLLATHTMPLLLNPSELQEQFYK